MQQRLAKSFQQLGVEHFGDNFNANDYLMELSGMSKAMTSGGLVNPVNAGVNDSAAALRLENLDATMTSVLINRRDFKLFNWMERVPTTQSLYQYNRRNRYGTVRGISGFAEGLGPVGSTAQFTRNSAQVKYLGVRRGVSHVLTVMGDRGGTQVDPVAEENMDGTMELLEKIERMLTWGDQTIHDETNANVLYDGLVNQMVNASTASTNVIDLRGDYLNFTTFDGIAENLRVTGLLNDFSNVQAFVTPNSRKTLAELLRSQTFFNVTENRSPYTYTQGAKVEMYPTNFGDISIVDSILLDAVPGGKPIPQATGSDASAPGVVVTIAPSAGAVAGGRTSQFTDTSKTVYYYVSSFNSYGETIPTYAGGSTVVTSGQEVSVVITKVTGAIGYRIYRNDVSNAPDAAGYIGQIAQPVGATVTFFDDNNWLPNTDIALVLERSPENMVIAQLLPLIKFPIAVTATQIEFFLLLYHTLVVKASERQHLIRNIGRLKDY